MGFDDIFTSNHEGDKFTYAGNEKRGPSSLCDNSPMCSWSCLGDAVPVADPKVSGFQSTASKNFGPRSDDLRNQSFVDVLKGVEVPISIADLPSPTIRGQLPSIKIPRAMYNKGVEKLKFSLLGKMDLQKIKRDRLVDLIKQVWKVNSQIIPLGKGLILFRFDCEADLQSVWKGGPYEFDKQVLWLQLWTPSFDPQYQRHSHALVWVRFPGLKIHLWEKEILLSLAKAVGAPISVDRITLEKRYGHFASVLVEVDMAQPLPANVRIEIEGVEEFIQEIEYWKLPKFCNECKIVGHIAADCRRRKAGAGKQVVKAKAVLGVTGKDKNNASGSCGDEVPVTIVDTNEGAFGEEGATHDAPAAGGIGEASGRLPVVADAASRAVGNGQDGRLFVEADAAAAVIGGYAADGGRLSVDDTAAAVNVRAGGSATHGGRLSTVDDVAGTFIAVGGDGELRTPEADDATGCTNEDKDDGGAAFPISVSAGSEHERNLICDYGVGSCNQLSGNLLLSNKTSCVAPLELNIVVSCVDAPATSSGGAFNIMVPFDGCCANPNKSGPRDHENCQLRNSNTSLVMNGVRQSTSVDIRNINQSPTVSSAAAGSSAGSGKSWKANSKLFKGKKKKAPSLRLEKDLRDIILSNRWEDLAEMDDADDYFDYSDDQVEPIVETTKKPTSSNVITRQQARQQRL